MAHSLEDISRTSRKFLLKPDWSKEPELDFEFAREITQFVDNAPEIYSLTDALAYRVKYGFTNLQKSDEKYILDFFADCQGRLVRFWLPVWENTFRLYQDASMYDEYILVKNVSANDAFYEHERIFIETTAGDIITRHVTAVYGAAGDPYETLVIETPLDRDLAQTDIRFFGRFILCRFDTDELQIEHITSHASRCSIDFVELVHEYIAESFES